MDTRTTQPAPIITIAIAMIGAGCVADITPTVHTRTTHPRHLVSDGTLEDAVWDAFGGIGQRPDVHWIVDDDGWRSLGMEPEHSYICQPGEPSPAWPVAGVYGSRSQTVMMPPVVAQTQSIWSTICHEYYHHYLNLSRGDADPGHVDSGWQDPYGRLSHCRAQYDAKRWETWSQPTYMHVPRQVASGQCEAPDGTLYQVAQ